jgi:hypothetical protein
MYVLCSSVKKDGWTTKEVPLIGVSFQAFTDHLFWSLLFSSPKQDNLLQEELEYLTKDYWSIKHKEIRDELKMEHAPNNLNPRLGLLSMGQASVATPQGLSILQKGSMP